MLPIYQCILNHPNGADIEHSDKINNQPLPGNVFASAYFKKT